MTASNSKSPPADDLALPARHAARWALGVAVVTAALLISTSPGIPMVWDEGAYLLRAEAISDWCAGLFQGSPDTKLSAESIRNHWFFLVQEEGHPALSGELIAAGWSLRAWGLDPLTAARLGNMLLFAAATGVLFYRLGCDAGFLTATAAVVALLGQPRMFAHAHFAALDGPLTATWMLAWATFLPALTSKRAAVIWGLMLALCWASKFTGWFVLAAPVGWTLLYRPAGALRAFAIAIPTAVVAFVLFNPNSWHHPFGALAEYVRLNLSRSEHLQYNISTLFLGEMYNLNRPLPWYNTLFWTAVAVPTGTLLLAAIGGGTVVRSAMQHLRGSKHDTCTTYDGRFAGWTDAPPGAWGMLILMEWGVLMVVRALPWAPPHDGIRLFLPSFAFLSLLAALGFRELWQYRPELPSRGKPAKQAPIKKAPVASRQEIPSWILPTTATLLLAGGMVSTAWYYPQCLSYYNLVLGGQRGAVEAGMETTYWWDGLDDEVLGWIHAHTEPDEKIAVSAASTYNLGYLRNWGKLRRNFLPEEPGQFRWYVLQCRPSGWGAADSWLVAHYDPVYQKLIRHGGWGSWKLDQPVVVVYSIDDARQAAQEHLQASKAVGR